MKKILSNKIIILILIIVLILGIITIYFLMNKKDYLFGLNDNTSITTTNDRTAIKMETTTIKNEETSMILSRTSMTTESTTTKKKVISKTSTKKTTKESSTTEKKIEQTECLTELEKNVPLYYDLGCGMRAEDATFELAMHWAPKSDELIRLKSLVQELNACDKAYSSGCWDSVDAEYISIKGTNNKFLRGYAAKVNIFTFENSERIPLAEGYIKADNTLQWLYKKY